MITKSQYRVTHLSGRCRTGSDKVGQITHAVSGEVAICGRKPKGKSAGWSEWISHELTCPKCMDKVKKMSLGDHAPAGGRVFVFSDFVAVDGDEGK